MALDNKLWTISDLYKFATKFQKVPMLCNLSWFHRGRPPLESKHSNALKQLAGMLGEPPQVLRMKHRVYEFIGNMLHLLRNMARQGLPWQSLPPVLYRLATRLNLIDMASVMETGSCPGNGALHPAKVKNFAMELVKAVQKAIEQRALSTTDFDTARFLHRVEAVEAFARETGAETRVVLQIWKRMYGETRRELVRQAREPSLSPAEWRLADLLLLHEPALPLLERAGKPVCPERSLSFLVRLVSAGTARLARREGEDPVFGTVRPPPPPDAALEYCDWMRSVWTAVHIAFCKRERAVSSVLLQRRWHELRRAAHESPGRSQSAALLLRLLPASAQTPPPTWLSLVQRSLVVDLTTLGCQNPDLLCLLDDIEHRYTYESKSLDNPPEADCRATQDTVRQLHAIDPSRAEVSIVFDPHSSPESDPVPGPAPAPAQKDDSLSFIIKQALNCRSIVRLTAPRLRELTDDILEKNRALADKQTAADSSDEEGALVIDMKAADLQSQASQPPGSPLGGASVDDLVGNIARRVKEETETEQPDPVPGLSEKLAMDVRVMVGRVGEAGPEQLARRYGVAGQGAGWWATNLHLAEKCRPVWVTVTRLRHRPPPPAASPDGLQDNWEMQESNEILGNIEMLEKCEILEDCDILEKIEILKKCEIQEESEIQENNVILENSETSTDRPKRFEYLYPDMLRIMARNARRYLPANRKRAPKGGRAAPQRSAKAEDEAPQLSELEKWEREKRVGLQYFRLPRPGPGLRSLLAPEAFAQPSYSDGAMSESDSDSREERANGILDDELSDLRRTEKPPAERLTTTRLMEAERPPAAAKRGAKQWSKEKRVKISLTSILNEAKDENRTETQVGGPEEQPFAGGSSYFKLPAERSVTAPEYAAQGGGGPPLMRADLCRPVWMISGEFVPLTRTPLPLAAPSYWGALPGPKGRVLTRVLFPDEVAPATPPADPLVKPLGGDPPQRAFVYDMVQDFATFGRLNSTRGALFLYSLRSGTLTPLVPHWEPAACSGLREVSVSVPGYESRPGPSAGTPPFVLQRAGFVLTPAEPIPEAPRLLQNCASAPRPEPAETPRMPRTDA